MVAAVDINEIEPSELDGEAAKSGIRGAFDLFETRSEFRNVGVEPLLQARESQTPAWPDNAQHSARWPALLAGGLKPVAE